MPGHGHGQGGGGGGEEVDTEKFYKNLGISKEATQNDIKKAYRKSAMKHHPDKGGDPEKFKEITKAYETLSDEEKRGVYDKYGEKGLEGGGGMDQSDIFAQMFGGGGGGGRGKPRQRKGKDVLFRLKVTLGDLYNGGAKTLRLSKQMVCSGCQGKGGSKVVTCRECRGQGVKVVVRQIGPGMLQQMQVHCDQCEGKGEICSAKDRCKECSGEKVIKTKKTLTVHIDKGMKQGSKIVFRQESDQAPGIIPGDVVVALEQDAHPDFTREGDHLFYKKTISLQEALTGLEFNLEHLDQRVLIIKSDVGSVIAPGSVKCIRDEGMPLQKNPTLRGNLYIEFQVKFPSAADLNDSTKAMLKKVLPPPICQVSSKKTDMEEAFMENVDMESETRRWKEENQRQRGQYDEDEEEEGQGGQQQCRAQ